MNIVNITKQDEKFLKLIVISLKKNESWQKENPDKTATVLHELFSKSHSKRYLEAMTHIRSKFGRQYLEVIQHYFKYFDFNTQG